MIFENIQLGKGACGRYKDELKQIRIFITFDNIHLEKGACGRYKNK